MNVQLNYHHLRYFLAVANNGGIKAASAVVNASPPTLSTQVRELESFLGTELFHREGRKMALTRTGRIVQRYAERIIALGDELAEVVSRSVGDIETVFLGVADSVPKLLVSRLLSRAWAELPGLRVVVREGLPAELFPALAGHQIDLVLANEPAPGSFRIRLFSEKAGEFSIRLAASPELHARYRKMKTLTGFPVLAPPRDSPLRRDLERWWSLTGTFPDIRAEFDDAAAMYELASLGAGAAPVAGPILPYLKSRYGLLPLPCRTGIDEELYLVTAEREVRGSGARLIARLAREVSAH
jgi:LysR family transcriptional activator of nhaA